jgi:type IV secretory pathway VirB10-like protein
MKLPREISVALLVLAAAGLCGGCRRNIVRAEPPSVVSPPDTEPFPQPTVNQQPASPPAEPPEVMPPTEPVPTVGGQPRPRPPVETEAAKPKPEPEPQPPQIAPQLSAKDQAAAVRRTTNDIRVAERNMQTAYGRQLNASQSDLVEKIAGFLAQAHEAIRTSDWVRAQNLAQKAQVLSGELIKSF